MKKTLIILILLLSFNNLVFSWSPEYYLDNIYQAETVFQKYENKSFVLRNIIKDKKNKAIYLSFTNKLEQDEAKILTLFIELDNKVWKELNFYTQERKALLYERLFFLSILSILTLILYYLKKNRNKRKI